MATFSKITFIALLTASLQLVASEAALAIGKLPYLENHRTGVSESTELAPVSRSLTLSLLPVQSAQSSVQERRLEVFAKLPGGVGRPKRIGPGSGTR